jgi:hypothetical protein
VTHFSVDTTSLSSLAERLDSLKAELAGVAGFASNHIGLGSPVVAGAVDNFCSAWKSGISKVDENIAAVAVRLHGSADSYDSTESTAAGSYESGGIG